MASEPPPAAAAKPPLDLPDPGNLRPLRDGLILKPEDVADNAPEKEEVKRQVLEELPLVTRQKPYFYSFEQREIDETVCMTKIRTGGFLGTGKAPVDKQGLVPFEDAAFFRRHKAQIMKDDGLYVGGADKLDNPSVSRLEQRLIREGSTQYFKTNGELKLHTELLAGTMTHPTDFSSEVCKSYSVRVVNALLSERLHQYKSHYYRMDVAVGRLVFTDHPHFSREQRLCTLIRQGVKDFEQRSNRRVIPFLQQRHAVLQFELRSKENDPSTAPNELDFIRKSLEEVARRLDAEKMEIIEIAERIMKLWEDVKQIREQNGGFVGDPMRLRVKKFMTAENLVEYEFKLKSHHQGDNVPVPRDERSRRKRLEAQRIALVLLVNDQEVARSKNAKLSQTFEADINEIFQLKLYSMPTSIRLRLLMGGRFKAALATIEVPIPGEHVYAMTSAAALTRELDFQADATMSQKLQWEDSEPKKPRKKDSERAAMRGAAGDDDEDEEAEMHDEKYKRDLRRTKGQLVVKAGWVGRGAKMPPTKIENLFTKHVARGGYEALPEEAIQQELNGVVEDINDPLNLELVRRLKESKNQELKQMLDKDALNPLAGLDPLRHKLMRAKEVYPQLHSLVIPLDDRDILKNPELMQYVRRIVQEEQEMIPIEDRDLGGVDQAMKEAYARNKEALMRRREFQEKLHKRQKQIKLHGGNVYGLTPKAIVKEFELGPQKACIAQCLGCVFRQRNRGLKPYREEVKPLTSSNHSKCHIAVHVIKGTNLPVRSSAIGYKAVLDNFKARQRERAAPKPAYPQQAPGYPPQGGYPQPGGYPGQGYPPQPGYPPAQPGYPQDPYNRGPPGYPAGGGPPGQPPYPGAPPPGYPGAGGYPGGYPGAQPGGYSASSLQAGGQPVMDAGYGGYAPEGPSFASGRFEGDRNRAAFLGGSVGNMFELPPQIERVRTIVEVRLSQVDRSGKRNEKILLSGNTQGPNPDWNEILHIPYELLSGKHFTASALLEQEAILFFNIFDVIRELKKQTYGQVVYSWERRYLGSLEIPLMTVFQNKGKIDAVLRMRRPLLMFEYMTSERSLILDRQDQRREQRQLAVEGETPSYMTVSIALQPPIELPAENAVDYKAGKEDGVLLNRGVRWLKQWRKKTVYKERVIKLFAEDVEGMSIYLPRFLSPQRPPTDFYDPNAEDPFAIQRVVRYVSLIPFVDDNRAFQDMPDIFCTSQQFLDHGAGDYEEHAILLCNYFNFIDRRKRIKSYLVFGVGYPEGYTCYVMRRNLDTNSVELWNAVTGDGYYFPSMTPPKCCSCFSLFRTPQNRPFADPKCPLKEVGCVVSDTNIYLNYQKMADPAGLCFNLENKKFWRPFLPDAALGKFFPRGVATVNHELLDYTDLETHLRQQLEEEVELYVAQQFEKERATFREDRRPLRTLWRNDLRDRLRVVLAQLEQFKFKMRSGATDSDMIPGGAFRDRDAAQLSQMKDQIKGAIGGGREVFGFPVNKSYTSKEKIWEEVRNTDVHNIPDEEAEFALACAVFNYPCTVYSVWVYIVCIQKVST